MNAWDEAMIDLIRPDLRGEARHAALIEMERERLKEWGSLGLSRLTQAERRVCVQEAMDWMRMHAERGRRERQEKWKHHARDRMVVSEQAGSVVPVSAGAALLIRLVGMVSSRYFAWRWNRRLGRLLTIEQQKAPAQVDLPRVDVAKRVLCGIK